MMFFGPRLSIKLCLTSCDLRDIKMVQKTFIARVFLSYANIICH